MKTPLKLLAATLSMCALLPASAQSLGDFVDTQVTLDPFGGTELLGGPSHRVLAQTLTVEVGGTIVGLLLAIDCGAGGGLVGIEIRDTVFPAGSALSVPGLTRLDSVGVDPKNFDAGGRFVYVPFTKGVVVLPHQEISIVLQNRTGSCFVTRSPVSPIYSGGMGFTNGPGFWMPLSPGAGMGPKDIPFQLVLQ